MHFTGKDNTRMTSVDILKQYFGYETFRDGQETLIDNILAGNDVIGVMPTGAGKSMCFQIPALMMNGLTLIISPLISLMKDQVNALTQSGVAAAFINSSLNEREIYYTLENAEKGAYKLIYIAPERLLMPDFISFAQKADIAMLTVDEAHCISQWGQDFRPSYAKIPDFIASLANRPILSAFTATATSKVRDDIVNLLGLRNPAVLVTGFDRKNLYFEVKKPKDKLSALMTFLKDKKERSGIIYCSTRANVENVCENLKENGYSASRYHAGLSDFERHENQDGFSYDRIKIMVATNAFGMGIDKSNVSFVVHYNMPKDIESYYQEAGRAGRDGEPADCVLLYSGQDVRTNLWLIENARDVQYPDKETEEMLKERDRKRLREMTFYCTAYDCLRGSILKYFGETPPNYCGNCGNCNTNFETADITIDAKKIISCVGRMKERYGLNMVVDVLRGSKSEKVMRLGLDKLSTYGISEKKDNQLREIINYLILNDYLLKTDDEYPVLKLGRRFNEVLRDDAVLQMKLSVEKEPNPKKEIKINENLKPVNKKLLEALRKLRLTIANEQNVPAFVIFHDSSLTDMCIKTPVTMEDFLNVSGIGSVKAERYGERFIKAIIEFLENDNSGEEPWQPPKIFDFSEINITEEAVTISVIADRINCVFIECGYNKINGKRINDWLVSEGYLHLATENNKNFKIPTESGKKLGIISEDRIMRGDNVKVNQYGEEAQKFIIQNVLKIAEFNK